MSRRLRIAQVAPPLERVPPRAYGGTERVVYELVNELQRRGHDVTLFASGDSEVACEHVPTVAEALRPKGFGGDPSSYFIGTVQEVLRRDGEFDIVHSHLEWYSLMLAAASRTPVVSTFHGRIDFPYSRWLLADRPRGLVAISRNQASNHPEIPWTVIHNGLTLDGAPFERRRGDGLAFVGRVAPEKGIVEAMEVAKISGRTLRIAAKIGPVAHEYAFYRDVFLPALEKAGSAVEFLGEVSPDDRDALLSESYAMLAPSAWPEPFGLTTIESLACGTPVMARRIGATPEIVRDGVDGFFADDPTQMAFQLERVKELDRAEIRRSVLDRFSAKRMVDAYESLYLRRLGEIAIETEEEAGAAGAIPLSAARSAVAARSGRIEVSGVSETGGATGAGKTIGPAAGATAGDDGDGMEAPGGAAATDVLGLPATAVTRPIREGRA